MHSTSMTEPNSQQTSCSSQPECTSRESTSVLELSCVHYIHARPTAPHCATPAQPLGTGCSAKGCSHGGDPRRALLMGEMRAAAALCLPTLPNRSHRAVLCIRETQMRSVIDSPLGSAMKNVWNYSCKVPLTHGSFVRTLKHQRLSAAYPLFAICSHLLS